MRVTVITARFPPLEGGVADYTRAWCRAMHDLGGFDMTVITSPQADSLEGVTVDASHDDWSRRGGPALLAAVERSKPDVVVVQYVPHAFSRRGAGLPFAWVLRRVTRSLGVPLVVNGHELYEPWWSNGPHRPPWSLAQRLSVAVLARNSRAFVVTVKTRQEQVQAALPGLRDQIFVLPVGPTILPVTPNPSWRGEHDVPEGVVVLASIGLGHLTQSTAMLETMLRRLRTSGVDARLFLAGHLKVDDPWAVHLGYIDGGAAAQLLAAADLVVLPLSNGASGRRSTLVSALAAGAPVLSTTGADTDAALFPPEAVRRTPVADAEAFASAAVSLASDPEARALLRERGRALYEREFAWRVVARRWRDVLQAAVDDGRR